MDNQQQQQMNVEEKRSVTELLSLGIGGAIIALGFLKGLHWAWPELFERRPPG